MWTCNAQNNPSKWAPAILAGLPEEVVYVVWGQSPDDSRVPLEYVVYADTANAAKPGKQNWSK